MGCQRLPPRLRASPQHHRDLRQGLTLMVMLPYYTSGRPKVAESCVGAWPVAGGALLPNQCVAAPQGRHIPHASTPDPQPRRFPTPSRRMIILHCGARIERGRWAASGRHEHRQLLTSRKPHACCLSLSLSRRLTRPAVGSLRPLVSFWLPTSDPSPAAKGRVLASPGDALWELMRGTASPARPPPSPSPLPHPPLSPLPSPSPTHLHSCRTWHVAMILHQTLMYPDRDETLPER